jgi:hypothetical protein
MHRTTIRRAAAAATTLAVASLGAVGIATAGPSSSDANGNFAALDVDVSPPQAGTKVAPRGVGLAIHQVAGNSRNGSRSPYGGDWTLRLPRGMRSNAARFPVACPLPASGDQIGQESRCPAHSKIGTGTGEGDARPAIQEFLPAIVNAYNGDPHAGRPTLILMITAAVGNSQIHGELDFEYVNEPVGPYGLKLGAFHPLPDSSNSLFGIRKLDLVLPDKVFKLKSGTKKLRLHLLEAPTKCGGSWGFSLTTATQSGDASLTAPDVAPCVKAPRTTH